MDVSEESRVVYRPSGNVDWIRFLPGLCLAAGIAIVAAWCLVFAMRMGSYLLFITPLIASLAVSGVWYLVLKWSQCRNPMFATVASVVLGVLLYFGYYHICMIQNIGIRNAHRIDFLPRYVLMRMHTDIPRQAPRPIRDWGRQGRPDRVQQAFNWLLFGGETLIVIGLLVATGRNCSAKAYCESCRKWMKSETLKLSTEMGVSCWDALQQGNWAEARQCLATTSGQNAIRGTLTVEHCPDCPAEDRSSAVYLTVRDILAPGMRDTIAAKVGSLFKPRHVAALRTVADHVALDSEEIAALAGAFPSLAGTIATHADLFREVQTATQEFEHAGADQASDWRGKFARIEAVDNRDAGAILTRRNAILQTVIGTAAIFGGMGLAFVPIEVLHYLPQRPPEWYFRMALGWMFGCSLLSIAWNMFFPSYLPSRFMLWRTRRAFEGRAETAVDLKNPALFFLDVVPRINWGKLMLESASDIGFLELDPVRRELIFEGDRERYWIPIESIFEIKHEYFAEMIKHQLQSSPSLHHLIVVRAMTPAGPWEACFLRRQYRFQMRTAKRRLADALELKSHISNLMPPAD